MASAPALAGFVEAVLGRRARVLPHPVLCIAVALEHIDWDLVAELTAEIDKQRNRREGEKGYMPCVVYIHAGFVKPFDLLLDAPAGLVDERLAFGVDRGEVYQMALGIRGISGSDGFRDLFDGNGDRLARNTRFELHYRGLAVRSQPGNEQDTIFVGFLVFLKNGDRVLLGMIVDELVTLGAQQHQIADIVDIGGAECCVATGTVFLEGDDMRHLREVAGNQRQGML
jgi:hypothetical protein